MSKGKEQSAHGADMAKTSDFLPRMRGGPSTASGL